MYLPKSFVVEPPESGWPNITTESMDGFGKTDEVVSLLRYLPYMRTLSVGYPVQGAPGAHSLIGSHVSKLSAKARTTWRVSEFVRKALRTTRTSMPMLLVLL